MRDEQCRRDGLAPDRVLNDNDMSIAPPVGALSAIAADFGAHLHVAARHRKQLAHKMPKGLKKRCGWRIRARFLTGRTMFESSLLLSRPIDGHNLDTCCRAEKRARPKQVDPGSLVTQKGKGYERLRIADKYHAW